MRTQKRQNGMRGLLRSGVHGAAAGVWALALLSVAAQPAWADAASDVKALTGARTRLVWVEDTGSGRDTFARGNKLRLMGLDTDDGKGARAILAKESNYAKPLLTAAGKQVVFSNRNDKHCYVVGFDGSGLRRLVAGSAADVWRDPKTGAEWVYVQTRSGDKASPLRRYRIDQPGTGELVWDKTPTSIDNFQLSADGARAAGMFPWPACGVAELPNRSWRKLARGCWTSLSPDDSYLFWAFDGPHRNVYVHDTRHERRWKVDIHAAPGIDGYEVYHPRWTNHVRFMVMTGPYKVGGGGNKIGGGGKAVEVYLGRFAADLGRIEAWARATHNDRGDFYPDAWIEGGEAVSAAEVLKQAEREMLAAAKPKTAEQLAKHKTWPGDQEQLVFLWENDSATNQIVPADGEGGPTCRVLCRGGAKFGRDYEMDLAGGSGLAEDADERLLAACRKSNALGIEAVLTPANVKQSGPARIVTFSSSASSRNFTLGQDGDQLVMRLRTPRTGDNGVNPQVVLCKIEAGRTYHVIVSYFPGRMLCHVDGRQVLSTTDVAGDFSNWGKQHLLFGDEWTGGRDWAGRLEGVAVYSRFIGAEEAAYKHALYAPRLKQRRPAPRIVIEGKLRALTPSPAVADLEDYARALVVYEYDVAKVLTGKCPHKRLLVAHWAILDRQVVAGLKERKQGEVCRLVLEPFDAHPQLEAERQFNDFGTSDLPLFYDVGP